MSLRSETTELTRLVEICRALAEPVRAGIMARIAATEELPCTTLEEASSVTKSTISYHIKILYHAGLIDVRKEGRNYYYTARRVAIEDALPGLSEWLVRIDAEMRRLQPTP